MSRSALHSTTRALRSWVQRGALGLALALGLGLSAACPAKPPQDASMQQQPEERFRAYLTTLGRQGDAIQEVEGYQLGEVHFFSTTGEPSGLVRAAVSDRGLASFSSATDGWGALVRAGEASVVAERIGWLYVRYATIAPGDRGASDAVQAPRIDVRGADATFVGWYQEPMSSQLFRLTLEAPGQGAATVVWVSEDALAAQTGGAPAGFADASPDVRMKAIEALAKEAGVGAIPHVVPMLGDASADVRDQAARTLGELGDRSAVAPLAASLGVEADPLNRISLLLALSRLGGDEARAAIEAAASSDSAEMVRTYAQGL